MLQLAPIASDPADFIEEPKIFFHHKNFTLVLGDSLRAMTNPKLAGACDMVFADPPYNLSNDGITCQNGRMVSVNKGAWDKSRGASGDFDFHHTWLNLARDCLRDTGSLWVSGTYHSIYQCGYALQLLDYHILNDIAWFKPNASPNLSCRYFTASHETLIWARKNKKAKHHFDYPAMKDGKWPGDFIKKDGLQMRSVWAIHPPKKEEKIYGKHPTQKPLELLRRVVLASTRAGDKILDPFCGSGTTGIAAAALERKFIGIDREEKYLEVAAKRFKDLNGSW
jgi:site-specific DNA-methyltransferase (adenine-specific)